MSGFKDQLSESIIINESYVGKYTDNFLYQNKLETNNKLQAKTITKSVKESRYAGKNK